MAQNFRVVSSRSTVRLVGNTDTEDVIEVWFETSPSHIRYPLYTTPENFQAGYLDGLASNYSALLEGWRHLHGVQAIFYRQDIDAAGDITGNFIFVLSDDSGNVTEEFPQSEFILVVGGGIDTIIENEVARLNGIAAL
jgi:hypothetical protein